MDHEALVAELEETGDYRVLRRLQLRDSGTARGDPTFKVGLLVDVETTGLDTAKADVIEIGLLAFQFDPTGAIHGIVDLYSSFRDPGVPIPAEITELTGITDEMVRGAVVDQQRVDSLASNAAIVIAHGAGFDRKVIERFWPVFATRWWGCSIEDIDWKTAGIRSARLANILADYGLFHGAHRAVDDCQAVLEILSRPLPRAGVPGLKLLLDAARKMTCRIWATNTDFKTKDALKGRGYLWNPGDDGRPKSWWRDVDMADKDAELAWLRAEIYRQAARAIPVDEFDARHRYSVRC